MRIIVILLLRESLVPRFENVLGPGISRWWSSPLSRMSSLSLGNQGDVLEQHSLSEVATTATSQPVVRACALHTSPRRLWTLDIPGLECAIGRIENRGGDRGSERHGRHQAATIGQTQEATQEGAQEGERAGERWRVAAGLLFLSLCW